MNLTISARAKSLNSLQTHRSGNFESQQLLNLRQQKLISKASPLNQQQISHSSHLTKWLLSKCFTRFNSIVEDLPKIQQIQPKQPIVIHNLSAKKNKEDTVNLHSKNKMNILSAKSNSQPKSKDIKIKLETCKEGKKNQNVLKTKTFLKKNNNVEPLKTGFSSSCIANHRSFYQKIQLKTFQTMTNAQSEISLKTSLCSNGTSRIDSFIQSNLKDSRLKIEPYKSKTLSNSDYRPPNKDINEHIFKKVSESRNNLQDFIFQPDFNEYSNSSKSYKNGQQTQQNCINYSANIFQSLTISKEIDNICQSDSLQKISVLEDEDDQDKAMEVFQYHDHDGHHYESMFTIYEKNDETFENE